MDLDSPGLDAYLPGARGERRKYDDQDARLHEISDSDARNLFLRTDSAGTGGRCSVAREMGVGCERSTNDRLLLAGDLCQFELTLLPGDIGLLYVCSEEVTAKDLISANCQLLAVPNQFAACKYAIVDLTYISNLSVSASELHEVADLNMRMAAIQPHLAVAVVAPTDLAFGMSRMWEVMAEKTGWAIMVFRTRAEGENWVRGIPAT
jgi:hypothetical protein